MVTPDDVKAWLAALKAAGIAKTKREAAALLGVHPNFMTEMVRDGVSQRYTARRTALAMAAIVAGIEPWQGEAPVPKEGLPDAQ